MSESVLHNIWKLNGLKMPALRALTLASLSRAAFSTLRNWHYNYELLQSQAERSVPVQLFCQGCISPACFDSPAIAATLRWASGGFKGALYGLPQNSLCTSYSRHEARHAAKPRGSSRERQARHKEPLRTAFGRGASPQIFSPPLLLRSQSTLGLRCPRKTGLLLRLYCVEHHSTLPRLSSRHG